MAIVQFHNITLEGTDNGEIFLYCECGWTHDLGASPTPIRALVVATEHFTSTWNTEQ